MPQNRFGTRLEEPAAPETISPEQHGQTEQPRRREPQREPPTAGQRAAKQRFLLRPKTIFQLLKRTYSEWSKDKAPRMGAALAYYTIFSLAPLLVIAIAIAGFVFGAEAVQGQIMGQIQGLVGSESARAVQTMIQSAHKPAHGVIATIFGIAILLLGASGVFTEMQDALNTIWRVDTTSKTGVWNLIRSRFLSFGMVLGIGFLLLVSLLLSAALTAVATYASNFLPIPPAALHAIDFIFSLIFIAALMALIFKFLPDVRIAWSDVWIGAALTSLLFTAGKFLIGFYIAKSVTMSAYGAAGSVVIILAWIYYSAQILYFGAEFTRVFSNECGSRCEIKAEPQPRAARAASA
ncbi:MAG TPA: YihY/virulence factor BrkB family protein [Candidatus Acidoferrum sp.]